MITDYVIEPLGDTHDRAVFVCGVEALDRYLRQQARQDVSRHAAAVYVLRAREAVAIAGYYTLKAATVVPRELPLAISKRLTRYPSLPAILIGRLALDQGYRGQGLGELLVMSALRRSLQISLQIGAVAVIVDAKDEAASTFYEHYHFQRFLDQEHRLFLPMRTIEQLFTE